jgi:hypothetical protein
VSYSADNAPVSAGGFTFTVSFNLTVGAASTNTNGQRPPYVNVAAPISGNASLTNTTANYTAGPNTIPLIGIFAVYPKRSAICQTGAVNGQPQFHPGPKGLCGVDIAELAAGCDNTVQSLATGQNATLVPWAQAALDQLDPASPQPCSNVNNFQVPDTVQLTGLTPDRAQTVIEQLSKPPRYWVLLNEGSAVETHADPAAGGGFKCQSDEYYVQGGHFIGQVISSKPDGVTGCLGGD